MLSLANKVAYEEGEQRRKWRNRVIDPFSFFTAGVDFVAGTAFGGTQPYGNNTNDGRLFRDPTNVTACIVPNADGTYASLGSAGIRRSTKGAVNYPSATVRNLQGSNLTNAVWVKSGVGPDLTIAKDQTGIDGVANAASSITCAVANGTVLQAITLAVNTFVYQVDIKRITGTGTVWMTIDGGTTWQDITSQIGAGIYALAFITQAGVTNPSIGFKMLTPGDKIAVDCNMLFTPPVVGMSIPRFDRVRTTTATILNSQSRPSADIADLAPNTFVNMMRGNFGFYHECTSRRPTGGFLITGATGIFCSVDAAGAGGAVKFSANAAQSKTADGVWKSDGVGVNRTAGFFTSDGRVKVCCNGALGNLATGGTAEALLDHWDLSTNGAGTSSLYSWTQKFYGGSNIEFTDDQLLQMAYA